MIGDISRGNKTVIQEVLNQFPKSFGLNVSSDTAVDPEGLFDGGVWITDIATRKALSKTSVYTDHSTQLLASLYKMSNVNLGEMGFEDGKDAQRFFESHGFKVEKNTLQIVHNQLYTPQNINIPQDRIDYLLSSPVVWVLTLKE